MAKKTYLYILGILVIVSALVIVFSGPRINGYSSLSNIGNEIIIYKSTSCGCCGIYGNYFQNKGNSNAQIVNMEDVDTIKREYGIPIALQSCHTTIIGDYFIEGHIPLEAVERLLSEQPDIAGIAMPGMPAGSPGMPGPKTGAFVIFAVDHNGGYEEFMRI